MLFIDSTEVQKPKDSGQSLHGEVAEICSLSPGLSVFNSHVATSATALLITAARLMKTTFLSPACHCAGAKDPGLPRSCRSSACENAVSLQIGLVPSRVVHVLQNLPHQLL